MTASALPPVERETVQCGVVEDGYGFPMAVAARYLLDDVSPTSTLIVPTAKTPFPRLLSRRAGYQPLWLADPSAEDLAWQRAQVGDGATYIPASPATLVGQLSGIGLVLNPFGLQHTIAEAPAYGPLMRRLVGPDGSMVTLDWGPTRYPEDLAGLPGIADEVRFARSSQLEPFPEDTGWALLKEREIFFEMPHSVDHVAALLNAANAATLRAATDPGRVIEVGSPVIYRLYRALPA